MQFITTQDGSPTIYDPNFGEHHHSLVGAYTEARYKFAELAKSVLQSKTKIRLLDLPFGLGYNLVASVELSAELPNKPFIECVAIEKDFEVIKAIEVCPFGETLQRSFDELKPLSRGHNQIQSQNFSLRLIVEDLLVALPKLEGKFDLIYYDPFSPRVASELWSKEKVLLHFARLLEPDGLLITYTASNKVRKGLLELGLNIAPGSAVGRKMPGTIGSFQKLSNKFTDETWEKIQKASSY